MYTIINDVKLDGNSYSKYSSSYGYGYGYGYGSGEGKKKVIPIPIITRTIRIFDNLRENPV